MVHNNKVLTVSYGTFSCTLEGFDDSFGTMKAIAEYFRDLSSDDRYFGSEPPQPDAEMLARIAQREIARQVEAHSTGTGGIVLRATDAAAVAPVVVPAEPVAPAPDVTPEPAPEPEPEVAAQTIPEPAAEAVVEPEPETQPEAANVVNAPEAEVETEVEVEVEVEVEAEAVADIEVTEDVAAIRPETPAEAPQMVSEAADEVAVEAAPEDVGPVDSGEDVLAAADDTPQAEAEAEVEVEAEAEPEAEAEDVLQDETPEQATEDAPTPEAEPETPVAEDVQESKIVPAADSIAAKLQRIRAVVSQNDSLAPTDEYTEDEDTEGFVTAQLHNINEALATEDAAPTAPAEAPDADDMMDVQTQPGAIGAQPDEDAYEVEEDIFADSASDQGDATFDAPDTRDDLTGETPEDADQDDGDLGDADQAGATGDDAPVQARVVKVKRADLEAAIATGQLEQTDKDAPDADTDATPEPAAPLGDSSLSPEDEDELMRELAAVEEELNFAENEQEADDNIFGDDIVSEVADAPEADADVDPVQAQEQDQDDSAQNALSQTVSENEVDLSRLMEAADEKLDDPETSSRRDTYSHLRAAVAAAEAEKTAGGSIEDKTEDDAYRDDLANVVRPRRTAIEGTRQTRRIPDTRPAPLKLVAEQRVDEGTSQVQRGAVRPRRVLTPAPEAANLSDATGADSAFADFAGRVGATELPELLEAAAAYLSFVEGQEKFSRPQLMNKVRLVKQDDYNREDGLRSFGQLLRDGKIEKRGGGRFAASGAIGFRPDDNEREAG